MDTYLKSTASEGGGSCFIQLPDGHSVAGRDFDQLRGFCLATFAEATANLAREQAKVRALYGDDCALTPTSIWRCDVLGTTETHMRLRLAARLCPCGAPATKAATTRGAGLCDDCQFTSTFGGE